MSLDGAEWKRRIEPRRAARPRGERPAENFGTCPEDDRPAAAARLAKLWATAKVVEAVEGEPVPEVLGRRRRRRVRRRLFGRGRMAVVRSPSDREHTIIPWSARDLSSGGPDVAVYGRTALSSCAFPLSERLGGRGQDLRRSLGEFSCVPRGVGQTNVPVVSPGETRR